MLEEKTIEEKTIEEKTIEEKAVTAAQGAVKAASETQRTADNFLYNRLNEKVESQFKLMKSILGYLQEMDRKIDSLKKLCVKADLFTTKEFEETWDKEKGLRLKENGERIQKGDIAWVTYVARIEGVEKPLSEQEIPVRVGSNRIAFEDALIGEFPNSKKTCVKKFVDKARPEYLDKKITFEIEIGRVKTPLKETLDGTNRREGVLEGPADANTENTTDA